MALVDATGAPSALGTAALGWPDGSGADGSKFSVSPNAPAGSSQGAATVKFDDQSTNAGTPNDISFTFDITFTNDPVAESAAVDLSQGVQTFPLA